MRARLRVAGAFDDQVEPTVEGELLEQVVVEPGAGLNAHPAIPFEAETDADRGLRRRANEPRAAPGTRLFAGKS